MSTTRSRSKKAPATDPWLADTALVLCGHGTRGAGGVLDRHADAIRGRGVFADIRVCSLYGTPELGQVLDTVTATRVTVVPWLMCAGYTMDRLAERVARHARAGRVTLADPVGSPPCIADLAMNIAEQACRARAWPAARTALLLIGHGSGRNVVSAETTRRHAERIAAAGRFAHVSTAFLDEPPSPAAALARLDQPHCVAVGLFAERSLHGEQDVPRLLGDRSDVTYTGPIGLAPAFADIMLAQACAAARQAGRQTAA